MAYKFTCEHCDAEMEENNRNDLMDMVQAHMEEEHDKNMSRSQIGREIEED